MSRYSFKKHRFIINFMFRFITNIKRNGLINKINCAAQNQPCVSACLQTQLVYEAQPVFALFLPRSRYECSQQSSLYFCIFSPYVVISAALPAHTHCTHSGLSQFSPLAPSTGRQRCKRRTAPLSSDPYCPPRSSPPPPLAP